MASLALIMRILLLRSAWETTKSRPRAETPMSTNRCSYSECSGSGMVIDKTSPKAVAASAKDTPCFLRFASSFERSHSNVRATHHRYREIRHVVHCGLMIRAEPQLSHVFLEMPCR